MIKSPTIPRPVEPSNLPAEPEPLKFGTIDFNRYYKAGIGKGGRTKLTPNISDKQATALANKLGLQAPKVTKYRAGRGRMVTGMDPKAKVKFLNRAENYYNKTVGSYNKQMGTYNKALEPYNKEVEAYNKEWEAFEQKRKERGERLSKPLKTIPDREKIGRAAQESKGSTKKRSGKGQALKGNMGRAAYEARMKESGQSMKRSGKGNKGVTMGRANYEQTNVVNRYNEGGAVKAAAAQMRGNSQYKPMGPIKQPVFAQNPNIGLGMPYTRTGGLDKIK